LYTHYFNMGSHKTTLNGNASLTLSIPAFPEVIDNTRITTIDDIEFSAASRLREAYSLLKTRCVHIVSPSEYAQGSLSWSVVKAFTTRSTMCKWPTTTRCCTDHL